MTFTHIFRHKWCSQNYSESTIHSHDICILNSHNEPAWTYVYVVFTYCWSSMITSDISLHQFRKSLLNNSHQVTVSINMPYRMVLGARTPFLLTYPLGWTRMILWRKKVRYNRCSNINNLIWIFDGGLFGRYLRFGTELPR